MRISYMYYLIKDSLSLLRNVTIAENNKSKLTPMHIVNYHSLETAFMNLNSIPVFQAATKDICYWLSYYKNIDDNQHFVTVEAGNSIKRAISEIKSTASIIIEFLDMLGFGESEQGFDVKMPPTDDFDQFASDISKLQKTLKQCPYFNVDGETVKIRSVDKGSIWLNFAVITAGTTALLRNIAKFIDECIKIRSHYNITKQQEEIYRHMKLKNDFLEELEKTNKLIYDELVNESIARLRQEISDISLTDNESISRLRYCIDNCVDLLDRGMEIYSSIDAPQEVKDLFPTDYKTEKITGALKQLDA